MKIGILLTGRPPAEIEAIHGGYEKCFETFLANQGFEFKSYAVLDQILPKTPNEQEGWIITGSCAGAYEDHAWIPPLETFLRECYAQAIPMFGVCFGHQILAQALGGKVEKFQGGWAVGPKPYQSDIYGDQKIIAWHQDQVTVLPKDAKVIGHSDFCENAILSYGNKALTIQPHPEFTAPFFVDMLAVRDEDELPKDIQSLAEKTAWEPLTSLDFAHNVARFFKDNRR